MTQLAADYLADDGVLHIIDRPLTGYSQMLRDER